MTQDDLYRLADGEEITSNLYGHADVWRPVLDRINQQKRHRPEDVD